MGGVMGKIAFCPNLMKFQPFNQASSIPIKRELRNILGGQSKENQILIDIYMRTLQCAYEFKIICAIHHRAVISIS